MNNIKEKAISGVKWNTISLVISMIVQILRLSVLTRLLEKSDFGLIAIASMVINFTDIFSELGLTVAVIHKQNITDKQYSSIYWVNNLFSILSFLILCTLTPIISSFYEQPILNTIIPLLGIQILLSGLGKMFQTIKSKNLEFTFISKVNISASIFGFFITIFLAYIDCGIYSLVIGQLVQVALMQLTYAYKGSKERKIFWYLNFKDISDFIKIGSYRIGTRVLDFISSKLDVFLIGRFFGMDALGIYNLAKDLIVKPYGMINLITNNVASSTFATLQNDKEKLCTYYNKIVSFVSFISIPIYTILYISADIIVSILYGVNYLEVSLLIRILILFGIECSISSQGSILQVALGRTDIGLKWTFIRIICSLAIISLASNYNIIVVSLGQSFIAIISIYLFWNFAIKPLINFTFINYVKTFIKPLNLSLLCILPFSFFIMLENNNMFWQILFVILFLVIYISYYFIFDRKFIHVFFQTLKSKKK